MDFESLLRALIPNPEECRAKVRELREANPKLSPEELAQKAISQAKVMTAVAGGASGLVTNPLAMVPVAFGEMGIVLKREAKLAGVIAAILDPDVLKDQEGFATDMLSILFPNAVAQALGAFAVRAGQATTRTLIRKYISKDVLKLIIKFAGKYLGLKLTQRAIITKSVPLIGAVIGAGWNWVEVRALGARAIRYYQDEDIAPDANA